MNDKYGQLINHAEKVGNAALIATYKIVRNISNRISKTRANGWSMSEWALRCEIRRRRLAKTKEELDALIAA